MGKLRNKKYNRVESVRRNNERILKNYCVCFFANDDKPKQDITLTNLVGDEMPVSKVMAEAITEHRYKWSIMTGVFCIEKGKNTCKFELIKCNELYLQSDLVVFLNEKHQSFIDKQKNLNVNITGAGWIASAAGRDFSEGESGYIFEKLGAF